MWFKRLLICIVFSKFLSDIFQAGFVALKVKNVNAATQWIIGPVSLAEKCTMRINEIRALLNMYVRKNVFGYLIVL